MLQSWTNLALSLFAVWPYWSHLTSLSLSFIICNTKIILVSTVGFFFFMNKLRSYLVICLIYNKYPINGSLFQYITYEKINQLAVLLLCVQEEHHD